jgi:hypothetical protein
MAGLRAPRGVERPTLLLSSLLLAGCSGADGDVSAFGPLELWSEPIADAIAVGEEAFPDRFRRNIVTLHVHEGRMWIGYGDGTANLGTATPVEFRYFADPDDPAPYAAEVSAEGQGVQRTPTDTGEEQINPFRICGGTLCQAGSDSWADDETWTQAKEPRRLIEGNFFRLEDRDGEPVWQKLRTVGGGEHVHDLAEIDGVIYAVGSGADDRGEWESGQIFRYLWQSTDGGASFSTVARFMFPELNGGDTRFRQLLAVSGTLYVFGYLNPEGGTLEGRHMTLRNGELADLTGDLASLIVDRTFELTAQAGLAVARGENGVAGATRSFLIDAEGYRELTQWGPRRVIDIVPESEGRFLLLSGDGAADERFALHRFEGASPDALDPVAELEVEAPTALALFGGFLFVGTNDGKVLRAQGGG